MAPRSGLGVSKGRDLGRVCKRGEGKAKVTQQVTGSFGRIGWLSIRGMRSTSTNQFLYLPPSAPCLPPETPGWLLQGLSEGSTCSLRSRG